MIYPMLCLLMTSSWFTCKILYLRRSEAISCIYRLSVVCLLELLRLLRSKNTTDQGVNIGPPGNARKFTTHTGTKSAVSEGIWMAYFRRCFDDRVIISWLKFQHLFFSFIYCGRTTGISLEEEVNIHLDTFQKSSASSTRARAKAGIILMH